MKKSLRIVIILITVCVLVGVCLLANVVVKNIETQNVFKSLSDMTQTKVKNFAREKGISLHEYPAELLELLENNPETEEFVLNYPLEKNKKHNVDISQYSRDTVPLFMQWDRQWGYIKYGNNVAGLTACGPVCLSMVAYYFTGDAEMSPDKIIDFALKNNYYTAGIGSKWTLISEGGIKLGLKVKELPLDENVMAKALNNGKIIIAVMRAGSFTTTGHFIVFTSYENGMFSVNDPNSHLNSEKLWAYEDIKDEFRNLWAIEK